MGFLYMFPDSLDFPNHVFVTKEKYGTQVILKTLGLPFLFWGYLITFLVILSFLGLAVYKPFLKLLSYPDPLNYLLVVATALVFILVPLITVMLFFYEKSLLRQSKTLTITHKIAGIKIRQKKHEIKHFFIRHFMDSPNLARMQNNPDLKSYENRGYFELMLETEQGMFLVDRHSSRRDLEKLLSLLDLGL
ncbi:MAG: hypothetical protein KBD63_01495 [Bacteriovoracaceae bacterium]|nr:hypothetical protein [Bacteriovoracaceae bacterium]